MSRKILLFAHTGRPEATAAATQACERLRQAGLTPVMSRGDLETIFGDSTDTCGVQVMHENVALDQIELGVVLGGDGSILRAAEMMRHTDIPLIGVNLGHVGFLAESERTDLDETVDHIVNRTYTVEERMAIDVAVWNADQKIHHTWALNEASVEKGNREKMIEVVIEVDELPLSTFGCDGVVMATPTGSTAYAFSGGGPVVWPEVEAMLLVPLSAHALFSRPMVTSPKSTMAIEILPANSNSGVLWCDGRRMLELPPGSRIEAWRSAKPVRLARIHPAPFSERLVNKFELPTRGWRGPQQAGLGQAPGAPVPEPGRTVAPELSEPSEPSASSAPESSAAPAPVEGHAPATAQNPARAAPSAAEGTPLPAGDRTTSQHEEDQA